MAHITCTKPGCKGTNTANIPELLDKYRNAEGMFTCACGSAGYVVKKFELQEEGQNWDPYLRGAIKLAEPKETYQPFVFLCSSKADGPVEETWFCYYKDMRHVPGGRLKMGYGPGGPPVLDNTSLVVLVNEMLKLKLLDRNALQKALDATRD